MRITPYCTVGLNELENSNKYMPIYKCLLEIKKVDNSKFNAYSMLRKILNNIIEVDTKIIYDQELLKVKEYVNHNKTAEVPYEAKDMWDVALKYGLMNRATVQLLVDYNGLGEEQLKIFTESLYSAMYDEVYELYEEIERDLDNEARIGA